MAPEAALTELGKLLERERQLRQSASMARKHLAHVRRAIRDCRSTQRSVLDEWHRWVNSQEKK